MTIGLLKDYIEQQKAHSSFLRRLAVPYNPRSKGRGFTARQINCRLQKLSAA